MKKLFLLSTFILLNVTFVVAQITDAPFVGYNEFQKRGLKKEHRKNFINFKKRLYFVLYTGLQKSDKTRYTLDISPLLGVKITNSFSAGLQLAYRSIKNTRLSGIATTTTVSRFAVFTKYQINNQFSVQAEAELLEYLYPEQGRITTKACLLGGTYLMPVGNKQLISITLLYNVTYVKTNPFYVSPLVGRINIALWQLLRANKSLNK